MTDRTKAMPPTEAMIDHVAAAMEEHATGMMPPYGTWRAVAFVALTAMQAARSETPEWRRGKYPHELRVSYEGGKLVNATIDGVEFVPATTPVQDGDAPRAWIDDNGTLRAPEGYCFEVVDAPGFDGNSYPRKAVKLAPLGVGKQSLDR